MHMSNYAATDELILKNQPKHFAYVRDIFLLNFMDFICEIILNISGKLLSLEYYSPISFH